MAASLLPAPVFLRFCHEMRIRILQTPRVVCIDGVRLDRFEPGRLYEVGTLLGCLLVAERWAEPVVSDEPALLVPLEPQPATSSDRSRVRHTFSPPDVFSDDDSEVQVQ